LRGLGIRRLFNLIRSTFGECDNENTDEIAIGRFHVQMGFNQRLPFTNEGSKFVACKVHAGKIGETVFALDFVYAKLNLSEGMIFIVLEVG
jgi:hypothetical protein